MSDVFSDIAGRYDRLNTILSFGRDNAWRRRAIAFLPPGTVVALGAGTGAANDLFGDRRVVAIDPEPQMLALNPAAERVVGVGEAFPFADGFVDGVFSAFVFRNLNSVPDTSACRLWTDCSPTPGPAMFVNLGNRSNARLRCATRSSR